jgi:hypothetical protein
LGKTKGPVELRWSDKVTFTLHEIKIFDYPEPIVLIGTDMLGHAARAMYTFAYLGVNPSTATGEIIFYKKLDNSVVACELVHAPTTHTSTHILTRDSSKNVTFPTTTD